MLITDNMIEIIANNRGTTPERPALFSSDYGFMFFDTTLGKPIWWDGSKWVDSTGVEV